MTDEDDKQADAQPATEPPVAKPVAQRAPAAPHVHGPNCSHDHHHGHSHAPKQPARAVQRPGRNEPCHCGSGKKYKKCHLRSDGG